MPGRGSGRCQRRRGRPDASRTRGCSCRFRVATTTRTSPGSSSTRLFRSTPGTRASSALGKIDIIDAVTLFFPSVSYGQEGFWNVNALVSALPWFGAVDGLSLYGGWLASINEEYQIGESAILVTGTENVTTSWSSDPRLVRRGRLDSRVPQVLLETRRQDGLLHALRRRLDEGSSIQRSTRLRLQARAGH